MPGNFQETLPGAGYEPDIPGAKIRCSNPTVRSGAGAPEVGQALVVRPEEAAGWVGWMAS